MQQYNVKVYGPYKICSEKHDVLEDCPYSKNEGIYFWAVKMDSGRYMVSYIGETSTSFYKRTKEHIIQTLGGNYQVCDTELMIKGEHKIIWDGLWRDGTRNKLPEFLANYETMAPKIKKYLIAQKLFVAPLKVDRRTRQRIEGAMAKAIKSNENAASLLPKDIRYYQKKENEEHLLINIESDGQIEGLPISLKA